MGYEEYIRDLDYEDLENLITLCKKKQSTLSESGKTPIYIVSCESLNHFVSTDRDKAVEYLRGVISLLVDTPKVEDIREFHIHKRNIWKSELSNWERDGFTKEKPENNCWVQSARKGRE